MKRYRAFQYELLRPSEVKSLQKQCLVAYIPVGSLEWHGVQNPLGTDGLKAYAIFALRWSCSPGPFSRYSR